MTRRIVLIAALALAGCSKPQSVTDLHATISALTKAGDEASISEDAYHRLVTQSGARFDAAKPQLSAGAAAACRTALDRVSDIDLTWRDTDGIADGLTPVVEAPLTRLGVVKDDKEFQQRAAEFIPLQESPDDDTAEEAADKEKSRDAARHDLMKQAMDGAQPVLQACEKAL